MHCWELHLDNFKGDSGQILSYNNKPLYPKILNKLYYKIKKDCYFLWKVMHYNILLYILNKSLSPKIICLAIVKALSHQKWNEQASD